MIKPKGIRQGRKFWIPGLYMADALPYVVLSLICVLMYKRLGIQNSDITFFTSLFYLPLILEPLFFPLLRMARGSRSGLLLTQAAICILLFLISIAVMHQDFFLITFLLLVCIACLALLHSISSNNYYKMSILPSLLPVLLRLRTASYRIVIVVSQGFLIMFAGLLEVHTRNVPYSWSVALMAFACFFSFITVFHFFFLPRLEKPTHTIPVRVVWQESLMSFKLFFTQKHILAILCFLLFFRMPEAFLLKIGPLFMLDSSARGGANLSIQEVGLILGTIAPLGVFAGYGLGNAILRKYALKRCFIPLTISFFLQLIIFWSICEFHVESMRLIAPAVFLGELCKGIGLSLFFRFFSCCISRRHQVMSAAICMAVMALGLCFCCILSGELQTLFGYTKYFRFILLVGVLPMLLSWYILTNDELLLDVENNTNLYNKYGKGY